MGIFTHHNKSQSNLHANDGYHMDDEHENQSSGSASQNHENSSSATHSDTSSHKSACGCGCGSHTKPMDEEVVEVKEEWDY